MRCGVVVVCWNFRCRLVHRRCGEDRGGSVGGDLPDEVSAGVCDEGVAAVVDGDVIGGVDLFGGEGGEEEAAAGAEVVGGEGVERREGIAGVDDGEEAVARGIDGEAEEGDVCGKVGV